MNNFKNFNIMKNLFLSLVFMLVGSFAFAEETDNKKETKLNSDDELCTVLVKETIDGRQYVGICTASTCQVAFDCARAVIKFKSVIE